MLISRESGGNTHIVEEKDNHIGPYKYFFQQFKKHMIIYFILDERTMRNNAQW